MLQCCNMMYDIFNSGAPSYLKELFPLKVENRCAYNLRSDDNVNILNLPKVNIEIFRNSFSYLGAKCWNRLPNNLRNAFSKNSFKIKCKQYVLKER